jgi:DMSO/TMAO reductase YedYZ heme-binding membrane subunit
MKYRRLLGITVFILAFTHGGIYIATWLKTGFGIASQWQNFWILSGYISLLSLFIGYLTSNDYSIKLFKGKWKLIQQSAYLGLIFVISHLMFLNPGEYR